MREQREQTVQPQDERVIKVFSAADRYTGHYEACSPTGVFFRQRVRKVANLLSKVRGGLLLDVGCGPGLIAKEVLRQNLGYIGVDLSTAMVAKCRDVFKDADCVHVAVARIEQLPFPNDCFDVVLCLGVLEYLDEIREGVREAVRVLRPGGLFIASMLNKFSPYRMWQRMVKPNGRHEPTLTLYTEREMRRLFRSCDLHVDGVEYFDFNVFLSPLDQHYPRWEARIEGELAKLAWPGLRWLGTGFLIAGIKGEQASQSGRKGSRREIWRSSFFRD